MTTKIVQTIRQKYIIDTVKRFKENHPKEWEETIKHSKEVVGTRANVYGSDKQLEWRWEMSIPKKLYLILDSSLGNPRFLKDDKEAEWFRKEFPMFAAQEKY